ncbi:MAG: 4-hydroxy-3-methylbut-2-enyl diphosphate reductase [Spirochaetes bacterium]|nr:4-hydroxy-3-methylbut-2-enyl diphosphate reductase [Spirochaetota bacterium]
MKIKVAENTGFCMGVRKAVLDIVNEINHSEESIYILGPLIHNPQTVSILQSRGLITIDSFGNINNKIVAIRTHGMPKESLRILKEKASRIINLTCPRVARVQGIVKKYSKEGYFAIIIGDDHHAEVESVKSYTDAGVVVISSTDDIDKIPKAIKYIVVAQTTFDENLFEKITQILKSKYDNLLIFNTICDSTHNRQSDVINAIKEGIDTLVVVGGKNSANTQRLAKIGKNSNIKTFHIETEDDLHDEDFMNSKYVLVTAGASTPGWIINNVLEKLYSISNKYESPIKHVLMRFLEIATRLNLLSSIASFFMSLLLEEILGIWSSYKFPLLSASFIFLMYAINNYFLKDTLKITNPFKYKLHKNNHFVILTATVALILFSMIITFLINDYVSIILYYIILFTGMVYSTSYMQFFIKKYLPSFIQTIYSIKSIPANIGWITITLIIPLLNAYQNNKDQLNTYFIISLILFLSFLIISRNLLLDFIGFSGDLIIGNITIPIILGLKKAKFIFYILSIISMVSIFYLALLYNIMYIVFIINIVFYNFLFYKIINLKYFISLKYEILTDCNFLLFIILCLIILLNT